MSEIACECKLSNEEVEKILKDEGVKDTYFEDNHIQPLPGALCENEVCMHCGACDEWKGASE